MTRLTDEQIDNVVHDVRQALGGKAWYRHFADRIAALAVQEVERDYWRVGDLRQQLAEMTKKFAKEVVGTGTLRDEVATLTAQLAEVTKERDSARAERADLTSRNTALRAQLAAVKEERDISRSLYREMYEHYQRELATLRAKLATAKRAGGTE